MDKLKNNALNSLSDVLDELTYQRQQMLLMQDILRHSLTMNVLSLSLISRKEPIVDDDTNEIVEELTLLNQMIDKNIEFFAEPECLAKWAKYIEKI